MKSRVSVCVFAVVMLLAALLVSCGGKTGGESAASAPAAQALADPKTPVTISYWYPLNAGEANEQDIIGIGLDKILEETGVTIQWRPIQGTAVVEQYSLLMASGDITDVVTHDVRYLKQYSQAFRTVDDIIDANPARYPSLKKNLYDDEYLDAYLWDEDSHLRIIPMLTTRRIGDILIIRKDLLQKYNGGVQPVTADDWYKLLSAAKNDGKIGFMSRYQRAGLLYRLLAGYMDCVIEDYFVEDGVVKYGVLDPRLKEGVELARKWYAEGLIDPEYPSTDSTGWWEGVLRGEVFATHDNAMRIQSANFDYIEVQKPPVPYRMTGALPIQSPRTGKQQTVIHYPRVLGKSASLSATSKVPPERILDFFEYCFSDEGFILMNFGLEGQSFNYVDGIPIPDAAYAARVTAREVPRIYMNMPINQKDNLFFDFTDPTREDHALIREGRDFYVEGDHIRENWIPSLNFTEEERNILAPINAELNTYRGEMLDRFIMGVEPMSSWDAFAAQIQKMNLDTALKIYQAALDRMLK